MGNKLKPKCVFFGIIFSLVLLIYGNHLLAQALKEKSYIVVVLMRK